MYLPCRSSSTSPASRRIARWCETVEMRHDVACRHRLTPQQRQDLAPHRVSERLEALLKAHYSPLFRAVNHVFRPHVGQNSHHSFPTCWRSSSLFHGRRSCFPQNLHTSSRLESARACHTMSTAASSSPAAQIAMVVFICSVPFHLDVYLNIEYHSICESQDIF